MSIFIRIEKFGAEPQILRLRGISIEVGEDSAGVLTTHAVTKPYFSLFALGERYLLRLERDATEPSGTSVAAGTQLWLGKEYSLTIGDYTLLIASSSNTAEALAHTSAPHQNLPSDISTQRLPTLWFSLAGLSRTFYLFNNLELSVGSSSDCAIQIDINGVAGKHLTLTNTGGGVICHAVQAITCGKDTYNNGSFSITTDSQITLAPLGIKLEIKFP